MATGLDWGMDNAGLAGLASTDRVDGRAGGWVDGWVGRDAEWRKERRGPSCPKESRWGVQFLRHHCSVGCWDCSLCARGTVR